MCNCGRSSATPVKYAPARTTRKPSTKPDINETDCHFLVTTPSGDKKFSPSRNGEMQALDYASTNAGMVTYDCNTQ